MNNKETLSRLIDLKGYIESPVFQEEIMKPLYEELDKQKDAYDCDTLKELYKVKGKKDGLKYIIKLLKGIETKAKNLRFDIENSEDED